MMHGLRCGNGAALSVCVLDALANNGRTDIELKSYALFTVWCAYVVVGGPIKFQCDLMKMDSSGSFGTHNPKHSLFLKKNSMSLDAFILFG